MYAWQFERPILIGDTVYFDDIIGKYENSNYIVKVFSYDIPTGTLTELAVDAKNVTEYKNQPAWLTMSEDGFNSLLYSKADDGYLYKVMTNLGAIVSAKGDMILINDYMSTADYNRFINYNDPEKFALYEHVEEIRRTCYGVKTVINGKVSPVIACHGKAGYITNLVTNGDIVGWHACYADNPLVYSKKADKLLSFEKYIKEDVTAYRIVLSDNYLLLSYSCNSESKTSELLMFEYS